MFFCLAGCIALASCSSPPEKLAKVIEKSRLSGAALVVDGNNRLLSKGQGYANQETGAENQPHTQFLVGSLTKLLTATAVLKLIDQGKIEEQAFLSTYLPEKDPVWAGQPPEWIHTGTYPNKKFQSVFRFF